MRAHRIGPGSGRRTLAWLVLLAATAACGEDTQAVLHSVRINAAPPTATVTAAYLVLENRSRDPLTLERVTSTDYSRIEMHRSVLIGGIARMEPLASVTVPAGERLEFRPGDHHLMLYRDKGPLPEGGTASLIFHFHDGTVIETTATVIPVTGEHHH